jgi:hypothetical protein
MRRTTFSKDCLLICALDPLETWPSVFVVIVPVLVVGLAAALVGSAAVGRCVEIHHVDFFDVFALRNVDLGTLRQERLQQLRMEKIFYLTLLPIIIQDANRMLKMNFSLIIGRKEKIHHFAQRFRSIVWTVYLCHYPPSPIWSILIHQKFLANLPVLTTRKYNLM